MTDQIKVGLVQQACPNNDKAANHAYSTEQVERLAEQGCKLVLLQELHSTQYFCQQETTDNFDLAEPLDGDFFHHFEALAKRLDLVLVTSMFERRAPGLYHNTALIFDGANGFAGKFRKMHIPDDPGFYEKFYFTPGDAEGELKGFEPIQTQVGKLGVLVCWDQWYPEAARLMALAGADILLYPTAIGWDPNDTQEEQQRQLNAWITVQRAHAIANGVYVLSANRVGFEQNPEHPDTGIEFWGNSFICGPQGEFLAHADHQDACLLTTDISLKRSEDVRRIWPYLRDRRIDAYGNLTKRYLDKS